MLSLTGYGRGSIDNGTWSITVELQTLNRKAFEVQVSGPREWIWLESFLVELCREKVQRGRAQFNIQCKRKKESCELNENALNKLEAELRKVGKIAQVMGAGPIEKETATILWALDKMDESTELGVEEMQSLKALLAQTVLEAVSELTEMRKMEGTQLAIDLKDRLLKLLKNQQHLQELASEAPSRYARMLRERLQKMDLSMEPDDERLVREIAIFSDRCDITEELVRLKSHFEQMELCLTETSQPVGRKMDFICQELHREFNTIGAKASLPGMAHEVIEAKQEIEKIREQVQNIL